MRTRIGMMMVITATAVFFGCSQKPPPTAAVVDEKVYTVTPDQVKVTAGVVTGEITEMKVTERVERGSGRIDTPARLTGKLKLRNGSAEHSVRLLGGKIHYLDAEGQIIGLEGARSEPNIRFSVFGSDRLEPGQDATHAVDVDFPAVALKSKTLKEIRLDLMFLSSLVMQETAHLAVSIGGR